MSGELEDHPVWQVWTIGWGLAVSWWSDPVVSAFAVSLVGFAVWAVCQGGKVS